MKKYFAQILGLFLVSPLTAFACDGAGQCLNCKVNQAARMLPGFVSTHAGLIVSAAIAAAVAGVILSRPGESISEK